MGQKQCFLIYWKILSLILLNFFHNENLYNLLCSCTNLIFGKIVIPEIWAKMFSANQIAGFFNQPYLQNKSMKYLACWYKFPWIKSWSKIVYMGMARNGCGQSGHWTLKLAVSQEWIDGMNWFFCMVVQIQMSKKFC